MEPMTPMDVTSQSENEASDASVGSVVLVGKSKGKRKVDAVENPFSSGFGSSASSVACSGSEVDITHPGPSRKLQKRAPSISDSESEAESDLFQSPPPEVPRSPSSSAFSSSDSDAGSEWSAQTSSEWDYLEVASSDERWQ